MAPSTFAAYVRAHLPPLGLDPDREAENRRGAGAADGADVRGGASRRRRPRHRRARGPRRGRRLARVRRVRSCTAERTKVAQAARRMARPVLVEPEGARPRRRHRAADVAGRALRPALAEPSSGLHRGGAADAGADHWRQLRHLQPGQRGPAGAIAVPRRRPTDGRDRGGTGGRVPADSVLTARLPRLVERAALVLGPGRLSQRQRRAGRNGRERADRHRQGLAVALRRAGRATAPRPRLPCRGRPSRRRCRHPEPRRVDAALQPRPSRGRPHDPARSAAVRRRRRAARAA